MSKTRVYQLAKKIGVSSKELIAKLNEFDLEVANHMSTLDDEDANLILEYYQSEDKEENGNKGKNNKTNYNKKSKNKNIKDKDKKSEEENLTNQNNTKEKELKLSEKIVVKELAEKLNVNPNDLIMKLMNLGTMAAINQEIDFETAEVIATEYGFSCILENTQEDMEDDIFEEIIDNPEDLVKRAPIVTVMGHVDHGKTSLLDAIRETEVTAGEAGGITQHIGASEVKINGEKIVFLDTPGHEAFTTLRARGAQITDIAILVVAADDGVMPQTIEAINHAKAAGVPLIVAVNKIDKLNANPDRVKQELSEHGVLIEEWGGDVVCVPVSAVKGEGIDHLLEMIILVSEMQELKANPNRPAMGTIIESEVDKGKGPVATVIVQTGTLSVGDSIIAGHTYGRVRAMFNSKGKRIKKAGPSTAVEILGLSDVPEAGDKFIVAKDDKTARQIAEKRQQEIRAKNLRVNQKVSLEDLFNQIQQGKVKDLNVIVKADAQGSVEALRQSLVKLTNEEVRVNVIHGAIGTITESDILLASASNAIIIGFNVRPSSSVTNLAERENIEIKTYRIIYEAIEDIEAAMKGMLEPEYKEVVLGKIEVRATFKVPNIGVIAGGYVLEGKVTRSSSARLVRDGIVIFEGKISSLKRFKDDVKEVLTGYECGIGLENYNDIKEGDIIESFIIEEVSRA
ncbi:translation initiation factor IF-2 [Paramaledivibacter caminithermalis]|jgi:translation initiation factor IF-2|uniref:Translation initiation factor IF-2 n=1 Tax=Paramaledivibacter caminithermalis (strain DSM 15212 / CIP 107654 / DViRD3) TaxID=1121301 RepID=A0A1M6N5E8_PARC5|nr:translation initiation factor IF-2 [Paramaledivibacter caminithermalis]SHJ90904.1 translation initiation factor IF-2 [Paramaledivibacter caminithermalis DSM 15212]